MSLLMRILIVGDEKKTAAHLQTGLTEQNFIVDVSIDGEEGLLLATTVEYDLIILDVRVPLWDDWSVLKELRCGGKADPATCKPHIQPGTGDAVYLRAFLGDPLHCSSFMLSCP
jgi:CheY-like chemotaxis protein